MQFSWEVRLIPCDNTGQDNDEEYTDGKSNQKKHAGPSDPAEAPLMGGD